MPAWYDIISLDENAADDRKGFDESVSQILELISDIEKKGVPRNKIILGGKVDHFNFVTLY
jgi:predicted esterase